MGFFDNLKIKESIKEGRERARKKHIGESTSGNDYRPSGGYDSTVASAVYSNYGVDSFDKIFEVTAPHMTKAIYDTRDGMKTNNAYYELEGRYNELQKHYNELQKQHNDLMKQQAELIELLKEKSKDVQR